MNLGFDGVLYMHSENTVDVIRSERRQYTMWFRGGWSPIFATQPMAVYPDGATGNQSEQSQVTSKWPLIPRTPESKPMKLKPIGLLTRPYVLLTAITACEGGIDLTYYKYPNK